MRSARTPKGSARSNTGRNIAAFVTPTMNDPPVRVWTSTPWATFCSQVPQLETNWPMKNRLKSRPRSLLPPSLAGPIPDVKSRGVYVWVGPGVPGGDEGLAGRTTGGSGS